MNIRIEVLEHTDRQLLREFLYMALFVPEGEDPFPESILDKPEIAKYINNWGMLKEDVGYKAIKDGQVIGVVWGRIFKLPNTGYGFVDEETPEITVAVNPEFRRQGIGARLMKAIEDEYKSIGIKAISLSVDNRNDAKKLYEKLDYVELRSEENAMTMRKSLT